MGAQVVVDRAIRLAELLEAARAEGRSTLSEAQARQLLEWYGIPIPAYHEAATEKEAASAAVGIGFPVALKAMVPNLLHKTEEGAVVLGLQSAEQVAAAGAAMADRLAGRIDGFIVERMAPAGLDLLVGVVSNPVFGSVVSLGLGGTMVELLHLVEFRLVPLSTIDAHELVQDERLGLTGTGLRNLRVTRPEELEAVLLAVAGPEGLIAQSRGVLSQFEVNPLRVTADGLVALDVKAVLAPLAPQTAA